MVSVLASQSFVICSVQAVGSPEVVATVRQGHVCVKLDLTG